MPGWAAVLEVQSRFRPQVEDLFRDFADQFSGRDDPTGVNLEALHRLDLILATVVDDPIVGRQFRQRRHIAAVDDEISLIHIIVTARDELLVRRDERDRLIGDPIHPARARQPPSARASPSW